LYYHATVIINAGQVSDTIVIHLYPNFDGLRDIMFVKDKQRGWIPFMDIGILEQLLTPYLHNLFDHQQAADSTHDVFDDVR